jgi:hypothetical protein
VALREQLHKQGEFWFRHRGKTALLLFALFMVALRDSDQSEDPGCGHRIQPRARTQTDAHQDEEVPGVELAGR